MPIVTVTAVFLSTLVRSRWESGHVVIGGQARYLATVRGAWDLVDQSAFISLPEPVYLALTAPGVEAVDGLVRDYAGAFYELTTQTNPAGQIEAVMEPGSPPTGG